MTKILFVGESYYSPMIEGDFFMRILLLLGVFITLILILQIFFLRLSKDFFGFKKEDIRFKRMVKMIYVNLIIYFILIIMLFIHIIND